MIRSSLLAFSLLSFTLVTACADDAADMQRDANKAQGEADAKIAAVGKEVGKEVVEAQVAANAKIDDATAKGDQAIRTAQAEADTKIAAVRADFTTLREEFRHDTTLKLVELDKKVAGVEAEAKTANGEKKAGLEAKLRLIHARRDAFMADYKTLETESAVTWDATKARLDRAWAALEASVAAA
ncbi:MAG: hypothetical protein Q8P41_20585 [Pseudomonadota bacterium]|nr:hypothetical protein [Pseudomonadota bacterium]